jgi:hypothetical protein
VLSVKNRHHTALFIQNNYLKLLIRKGPLSTNAPTKYASEWMWKISEINDNQWHAYKFIANYPEKVRSGLFDESFGHSFSFCLKIDLYVDGRLVVPTKDNFRIVEDTPLREIPGTEETTFALGACWHGKIERQPLGNAFD